MAEPNAEIERLKELSEARLATIQALEATRDAELKTARESGDRRVADLEVQFAESEQAYADGSKAREANFNEQLDVIRQKADETFSAAAEVEASLRQEIRLNGKVIAAQKAKIRELNGGEDPVLDIEPLEDTTEDDD